MDDDRLMHSYAVKMVEIGQNRHMDEEQLQELFVLRYIKCGRYVC